MDYNTIYNIREKYKNNIIKDLPDLIIWFLENNKNYLSLFLNNYIKKEDIIYFLRNKPYKNKFELLDWILSYIEARHGIFERLKRKAEACSNNTK